MADSVDTQVISSSPQRYDATFTNISDGTGESGVIKIDKSTLTGPDGTEPGRIMVNRIEYDVGGMQVRLYWDHTTDDEIAVLSGAGFLDFTDGGRNHGKVDPASAGGTGDVLLTTNAHTAGDAYTITMRCKLKD